MKRTFNLNAFAIVTILLTAFTANAFSKSKPTATFNIISYNIRMNTPGDSLNAWPLRKDKVAGLLRFHQTDIFAVQEALPEQMDDLTAAFPEFDHVGVGRDDGARSGEHTAIFYKKNSFEKLNDGVFWLNETPEKPGKGWDAAHNRTVTWIKLKHKTTGKSFYVFNTHFDNQGKVARDKAALLTIKMMKEINKVGLPLILTGDLNLSKNSSSVQLILGYLSDAMDKTITPHYGPVATSGGFAVKVLSRKIDYIFINDKVKVLRHAHLSDSFGLFYLSDHLPVFAEISIN
jgi:endonuclease/exonuclease/phosphatase family metal-dependent hydrolase